MTCQDLKVTDLTFSLGLHEGLEVLVKEGDLVKANELLASGDEEEFIKCNLAEFFAVPPQKVNDLLGVSLGTKIEKEQLLASSRGVFGKNIEFKSPTEGMVTGISKEGVLKIKTKTVKRELRSPANAYIKEIGKTFLILEFQGCKLEGKFGMGPKVIGPLEILGEKEAMVELSDLNPEQKGKVLLIGGKISQGLCHKAEALTIAGLIGGSAPAGLATDELAVVIFDDKEEFVPDDFWEELQKQKGEPILISGSEKYLAFNLK